MNQENIYEKTERPGRKIAILIDGPGGVGKSTLVESLTTQLQSLLDERGVGLLAYCRHFPSQGVPVTFSDMIRDQISTIFSDVSAHDARGASYKSRDAYFVFDRWGMSTAVYQAHEAGGEGVAVDKVLQAYEGMMYLFDQVFVIHLNAPSEVIAESRLRRVISRHLVKDETTPDAVIADINSLSKKAGIPDDYRQVFKLMTKRIVSYHSTLWSDLMDGFSNGPGFMSDSRPYIKLYNHPMSDRDGSYVSAISLQKVGCRKGRLVLMDAFFDDLAEQADVQKAIKEIMQKVATNSHLPVLYRPTQSIAFSSLMDSLIDQTCGGRAAFTQGADHE